MIDAMPVRYFHMHRAHRSVGLSAGVSIDSGRGKGDSPLLPKGTVPFSATAEPVDAPPLRVGLIAGAEEVWDASAALLAGTLHGDSGLDCSFAWEDADFGLDDETGYDCVVLLGWPAGAGPRRLARLEEYCRNGGSLVALRSTHGALPSWPGFAEEVIGGRDQRPQVGTAAGGALIEVERSESAWHHPILEGFQPFLSHGQAYQGSRLAPDATVLLVARGGWRKKPMAWIRQYRGGRIFASTLGQRDDLNQPSFLRLVTSAIHWAGQP